MGGKINTIGAVGENRAVLRKIRFLEMISHAEGKKVGTAPGSIEQPESAGTVMNSGNQGPLTILSVGERDLKDKVI